MNTEVNAPDGSANALGRPMPRHLLFGAAAMNAAFLYALWSVCIWIPTPHKTVVILIIGTVYGVLTVLLGYIFHAQVAERFSRLASQHAALLERVEALEGKD